MFDPFSVHLAVRDPKKNFNTENTEAVDAQEVWSWVSFMLFVNAVVKMPFLIALIASDSLPQ